VKTIKNIFNIIVLVLSAYWAWFATYFGFVGVITSDKNPIFSYILAASFISCGILWVLVLVNTVKNWRKS